MSPFTITVVLILTLLFVILSIIPLLPGQTDIDSPRRSPRTKTKTSH